jgi:hypothetical protein
MLRPGHSRVNKLPLNLGIMTKGKILGAYSFIAFK